MSSPIGQAFHWPVRIYWEDTDAGGIVFYANYLKFFERARTEWLRDIGIGQQSLRESEGGMFVVSASQVNYLRPARLDDVLSVSAQLTDLAKASMTITQAAYRMVDGKREERLCEGSIRIAWVNAQTMHPARIPPGVLAALQATH
jgi:acyl-CoA thioester hydrolase